MEMTKEKNKQKERVSRERKTWPNRHPNVKCVYVEFVKGWEGHSFAKSIFHKQKV